MEIGYARVSTDDQHPELQIDALKAAGCERIYTDHASGAKSDRPQWTRLMDALRKGDTLVVWRLDRAGRSVKHLVELMGNLERKGIQFKSLTEGIDTSTCVGRLTFHIFASIAQFERELLVERTNAGLNAARARGRKGGRPHSLDASQSEMARKLYNTDIPVMDICRQLGISKKTFYRYVRPDTNR